MQNNLNLAHLRALHAAAEEETKDPEGFRAQERFGREALNAFPALADRLEAAEREREELRAVIKREHEAARLRREAEGK